MTSKNKIGFIGFGRMGSILGGAFVESGCAHPREIVVFDKHSGQRREFRRYDLAGSAQEVVERASVVFVCVRPLDVREVARSVKIEKDTIIVSIAAGVSPAFLRRWFGKNIIRVIPSYTQKALAGVLLYCYRKDFSLQKVARIVKLLQFIGEPIAVPELWLEIATDLSSCSPAFWAYLASAFTNEAVRLGLPRGTAQSITAQALLGSAKILVGGEKFENVIDHVATPGGITREGIEVLEEEFPHIVKEIFTVTGKKYSLLRKQIEKSS